MEISHPILLKAKKQFGKKSKSTGTEFTLVLRPSEFSEFISECKKKYQVILSSLLFTAMRYEELIRLRDNPTWLDGKFINMPEWAQKKAKRVDPERWIRLSYAGREAVKRLYDLNERMPARSTVDQYIEYNFPVEEILSAASVARNTLEHTSFSIKSFRKTYLSWLAYYYRDYVLIAQSAGHTTVTEFNHYLSLPFDEAEKHIMGEYVEGWS